MTGLVVIASAVLLILFGLLCIATADMVRTYLVNRKRDAFDQHKRDHDYIVKAFSNILREAALKGRK